ncbi:MAG: hypothetical protein NXI23_15065 [Bacteroidetes bacterium]|jgi:RNase P/RNase MRP subunit p29|nr:hypothetical protein [Bacteroidota bacterium]MDF1867678.1 hypothetical protein [Saprospiraceae bacterium]
MYGSIEIKVVKETSKTVVVKLINADRNMPVPKEEFEKRVADGTYKVIG